MLKVGGGQQSMVKDHSLITFFLLGPFPYVSVPFLYD